ncbi:MAG: helix-turn-helix transcriptional regulator [Actinomycetota bacterium]|nr:helix-turn-helix transcriptional regulator [Actinomycetota bacterium]
MDDKKTYSESQAIYVISVAAELAGVHPQTLRVYERKGLLQPQRTAGNTRRYSDRDIGVLRRIQELTQEGMNLAGVMRIMELELEIGALNERYEKVTSQLEAALARLEELASEREHTALVPFKDVRRVRRAMKSDALEEAGRRRTFPSPPVDLT